MTDVSLSPIKAFFEEWKRLIDEANTIAESSKKKNKPAVVNTDLHLVLYTDGGCNADRGIGGWGVHGYQYISDEPKQGHGCPSIPTRHGYMVKSAFDETKDKKVTVVGYIDGCGSLWPEATNNQAELDGFIHALKLVLDLKPKSVLLILDSKYVLKNAQEYLAGWVRNNWIKSDGLQVANMNRWKHVHELMTAVGTANIPMDMRWTKGHGDDIGNICADVNATRGKIIGFKRQSIVDLRVSDPSVYWKSEVKRDDFLYNASWLFINDGKPMQADGYTTYYTTSSVDEEDHGKKIADVQYAIAQLQQPDPILEMLRRHMFELDQPARYGVVEAFLKNIYLPRMFKDLNQNEVAYTQRAGHDISLRGYDKTPLTLHHTTPRRAFLALTEMRMLEDILTNVRTGQTRFYGVTDITDVLYDEADPKKGTRKLKADVPQHAITIPVNYTLDQGQTTQQTPITLTFGVDLPHRMRLSAMGESSITVSVITWIESPVAFRNAVVIKRGNDYGIWAATYSNLHILK